MRTCHRCDVKMLEGFDVKVEGGGYGIKIAAGTGFFAKRIEKPKSNRTLYSMRNRKGFA